VLLHLRLLKLLLVLVKALRLHQRRLLVHLRLTQRLVKATRLQAKPTH
jgi:hypothetical protein